MNPLVIIAAHAGTEPIVERHMPYWLKLSPCPVFFSPVDAVVQVKEHPVVCFGEKGHHNAAASKRFEMVLRVCLSTKADQYLFLEYDAIVFGSIPEEWFWRRGLWGNVFRDDREQREFKGTMFVHPPLLFDRTVAECLFYGYKDNDEVGHFWDREVGRIVERFKIKTIDLLAERLGYSQNTIEPQHYDDLAKAVRGGARFIHGIKSAEALAVIERNL